MNIDQVERLANHLVLPGLAAVVARGRRNTAEELAFIAIATERKLYLPEGYSSMFAYCVGELGFSEDATFKRTQAAGAARKHPAIFDAVADGRLHLSAVVLLAPHMTRANAAALIAAASRKTRSQIERLLAERFPKPDVPTRVRAVVFSDTASLPAPGQVNWQCHQTPAAESDSRSRLPVGCANVLFSSSSWGHGGYTDSLVRMPRDAASNRCDPGRERCRAESASLVSTSDERGQPKRRG